MKKLLLLLPTALLLLPATPVSAEHNQQHINAKLSVAICHNVLHNGHVIIVADNALGAHAAHLGETDIILGTGLRADLEAQFGKAGTSCGETTTETTTPTTPTTAPPVTTPTTTTETTDTTTGSPSTDVVEETPVRTAQPVETPDVSTPAASAPSAPQAPAPTGELPRTGGSPFLALMGGSVTALGVILRRLFR